MTSGGRRPSIHELITERETIATATAERLRQQIAALTEQLTAAETELAELAVTRATLIRLTGEPEPPPAVDATVASPAYQQILAVLIAAAGPLRVKEICHALDLGITPKDIEGTRAKLKRLTDRRILTEPGPGLFALASSPPSPAKTTDQHS